VLPDVRLHYHQPHPSRRGFGFKDTTKPIPPFAIKSRSIPSFRLGIVLGFRHDLMRKGNPLHKFSLVSHRP
jgi:hypothetical protein